MRTITEMDYSEQEQLLDKLQVFKIQGRDKRGLKVLRIIGKLFPARKVSCEGVKKYLEEKIYPALGGKPFAVVYVQTSVQRGDNFPGISALRSIFDAIPMDVADRIDTVYFLHPGLQSRLFLAAFGRLILAGRVYSKFKYVTRIEFLWEHIRRREMELPVFAYEQDEELEYRPMTDYGMESDHLRIYGVPYPSHDSSAFAYSMRCVA